ncbi:MAG: 30S ribosomal protein S7 [Dehalococcoidia bacterium]|nr:30S ribosomal protein S7 [Dehalococcoidia bacterium]
MPRRAQVPKREPLPDAIYHSVTVAKAINKVMEGGKKATAERIVYDAFGKIEEQAKTNPVDVLEQAIKNTMPILQVKPRRIGGATYQVPVEVRPERRLALSMRWLFSAAKARGGKSFAEKLAAEIMDASKGQGAAVKKKDDTHKMAEANKAFVHYRW